MTTPYAKWRGALIASAILFQVYQQMTYAVLFIKGVPPILFVLFIGPWSDRFGRKPLMIVPLIG